MTPRTTIVFDFDGTLTRPYLDFDAIREEIGAVAGPILEAMELMDADRRHRAEQILLRHEWDAARNAELQPGAAETIAALRSRGLPVAILTRNARDTVKLVLDSHHLVIDAMRTREDGAIKPSPDGILSICAELGTDPRNGWMIGDYRFDILTGKAAGTQTVLMIGDGGEPDYAHEADYVIRRLEELLPLVCRQ